MALKSKACCLNLFTNHPNNGMKYINLNSLIVLDLSQTHLHKICIKT